MFVLIMAIFRDYIPNFYGNHMENQRGLWMPCGWLVDIHFIEGHSKMAIRMMAI